MNVGANAGLEIIRALGTAAGTGYAVLKTMAALRVFWAKRWPPLNGDQKFWLAVALSFIYPLLAYGFMSLAIIDIPLTWDGVIAAFGVGYVASQKWYRDRELEIEATGRKEMLTEPPTAGEAN